MATVVIAATVVLTVTGYVSGGEAMPVIVAAGGFTLAGTITSGSISTAANAAVDVSHSASGTAATRSQTPSTQSPTTPQTQPTQLTQAANPSGPQTLQN